MGWPLTELDTHPGLVKFASHPAGRACLILLFAAMLAPLSPAWLPISLGAAACAWVGRQRFTMVSIATLALLCWDPFWFDPKIPELAAAKEQIRWVDFSYLRWMTIAFYLIFAVLALETRRRLPDSFYGRRPVLTLLTFYLGLVMLATSRAFGGILQIILWSFIDAMSGYFWFLAYALQDQSSKDCSPLHHQLGAFHPFWGSSLIPVGKGASYLRQVEAHNDQELAITQLKGVKLLGNCLILHLLLLQAPAAHTALGIPRFEGCYLNFTAGHPDPTPLCWLSLITDFLESLFSLAVWGNTIVACARMAGFRLLRNTYKPLQSRSIAEFWNRFYYYFKELLVEFFFYPTFLRYFRKNKKMRIAFATFMAAGLGNALVHFMKNIGYLVYLTWSEALQGFSTYIFYCCALAAGIAASQLHTGKPRPGRWGAMLALGRIVSFYCFLHIFDDEFTRSPLWEHFRFISHLFGLS